MIIDQKEVITETRKIPIIENGKVCKIITVIRDITENRKAEEELRKSERGYRELVEKMNEGLVIQDKSGKITFVNESLCRIAKKRKEEIVGTAVKDYFRGKDKTLYDEIQKNLQEGQIKPFEKEWIDKDGERIVFIISPKILLNDKKEYDGAFVVITDITKYKKE